MSAHETDKMLHIINDLLNLTRKMSKSASSDFLIDAVDRRGELMSEYDALKASCTNAEITAIKPQVTERLDEIIELDKKINKALTSLYNDAKQSLQSSNQNNKILQYTNQAISSTGSYIDLKE